MKWQIVQHAMGNNDYLLAFDLRADGRYKFIVKFFQMRSGRAQKLLSETRSVFLAQVKLGYLKLQQPQQATDTRRESDRNHLQFGVSQDSGEHFVTQLKIFQECGAGGQCGANFFQRDRTRRPQACGFCLFRRQFTQHPDKSFFALAKLLLQMLDSRRRAVLLAKLLLLDAMVVPV